VVKADKVAGERSRPAQSSSGTDSMTSSFGRWSKPAFPRLRTPVENYPTQSRRVGAWRRRTREVGPCPYGAAVVQASGYAAAGGVEAESPSASILQAMANLLVRDLPDDVHAALQQRAKREGQSLQQYVARELTRIAQRPSLGEVLDRIERRTGGTVGLARAADDLAEERSRD
jgi:plasmid stability protein